MSKTHSLSLTRPATTLPIDLLLFTMAAIWGFNFSIIKISLQSMSPYAFNVLRFSLATLLMALLLWRRGESFRVERRDIPAIILIAFTGHVFYQVFFIGAVARTSPANTSVLLATMPMWVAVYGQIFGLERANRTVWLGILISFAGIVLLILGSGAGFSTSGSSQLGDLMCLVAAMMWAAYTMISSPLLTRYSPVKITTLEMVIGTPFLIMIGLPGLIKQDWQQVPPVAWGGVLYSAILATVVGYVLWTTGVQRAGNTRTAIYANVNPVIAVFAAWLLLGNTLRPGQIVGAVIVLAGVMLTRQGKLRGGRAGDKIAQES